VEPLLIIAIVIVLAVVGVLGLVAGTRRRGHRALPSEQTPVPTDRGTDDSVDGAVTGSVAVDERGPLAAVAEPAALEVPEPAAGRMRRLRGRLARSQGTLGSGLIGLLSRGRSDEAMWTEVEETLLVSDLGVGPTQELIDRLRAGARGIDATDADALRELVRTELLTLIDPGLDRSLHLDRADREPSAAADGGARPKEPAIVLVVGVNGTGKTTTTGKLARVLVADGRSVLLGAADTFRAAAVDQLQTWGDRVGATTVRGADGADPASVAYQAVNAGVDSGVDVVLIDTAGRLHTKAGLMDELAKVKRVVEKIAPVGEVLLVLDATTGQNGLIQARVFADVVDVTGIVLTKLDGTAKGGIVVAVQRELGVPVKLVGLGEGPDDLAPFDPEAFVDALLG
jgi:fused signal recognition particle receptor